MDAAKKGKIIGNKIPITLYSPRVLLHDFGYIWTEGSIAKQHCKHIIPCYNLSVIDEYFRAILKSIPTVTLQITLRIKKYRFYIFTKILFIAVLKAAINFEQIF
jgi:hypothetical protein